jgi:hypothetical protein
MEQQTTKKGGIRLCMTQEGLRYLLHRTYVDYQYLLERQQIETP